MKTSICWEYHISAWNDGTESSNYLGQYLSLSSTVGAATGVGAMGRNFLFTLDFENELIHAIMMNDGGGSGNKRGNGNGIENSIVLGVGVAMGLVQPNLYYKDPKKKKGGWR